MFWVSFQAWNNSHDDGKSVTENWDVNPLIASAAESQDLLQVLTHKETCDNECVWRGDHVRATNNTWSWCF